MRYLIFILLFSFLGSASMAQSKEQLELKKSATQKELSTARALLSKTAQQKDNTLKRLAVLNSSIVSRESILNTINLEIDLLNSLIDSLNLAVKSLEGSIEKGKNEYAALVVSVYKNHTDEDKIMYLLASKNINEFYQRIKYIKYLNNYREKRIKELDELIGIYEKRTNDLIEQRQEKKRLLEEKSREAKELLNEKRRRTEMISKLAQDEDKLKRQIRKNERVKRELEEKILRMIEEETRRNAGRNLLSSLTPEQKLIGESFENNKGRLPWPVERGVITTKFGLINHPVLSGVKISNHGVDISSVEGAKARAVFDGEVTGVSAILGANYVVLIMHGEYISVYQNLIDLKVKIGDRVTAKQEIGVVHSDPEENVAVLHLQLRKQREALNPEMWLSK